MIDILIGLPIYQRAWILPTWLKAIEKQTYPLSNVGFIFEMGPDDDETHNLLWEWHMDHPEVSIFDGVIREDVKHSTFEDGMRTWAYHDYTKMVILRNHLLDRVRAIQPQAYFSLDSDIILENPDTLTALYSLVHNEGLDAVNTLSYMWHTETAFPSVMSWVDELGGAATRKHHQYEIGKLFPADIIMASVMMSPQVYNNTTYRWHPLGEDVGWSFDCGFQAFNLYCASFIYTPHILHPSMLDPYLQNGDPRMPK